MDWITDQVAIGNHLDANDPELLRKHAFGSILCLDGCQAGKVAGELGVRRVEVVKLVDAAGNDPAIFVRAVERLCKLVDLAPPVLVHCHAGRSRSPVVVAGFLMRTRGMESADAVRLVASKRETAITPAVAALLRNLVR